MNITLQTNNFNSQNRYNNITSQKRNLAQNNQVAFKAGIASAIPQKSKLLDPFSNMLDKFTSWLSKNYTDKLYTSWFAKQIAKKADKLDSVVDIMSILGSTVISGMYMIQTLRNKQLDDDRKQTLAINQGLTYLIATAGSVVIDQSLDNWWEGKTAKYADSRTGLDISGKIKEINDKAIAEAEEKFGKKFKKFNKKERKATKLTNTLKYIEDNLDNAALEKKIRGMGVLKKLIIFGMVYRFLSPVAVTPFANMIGNKLAEVKKANKEAKLNQSA